MSMSISGEVSDYLDVIDSQQITQPRYQLL